ncbi:MAG: glycosyltransferase, partial [Planctomycetota bacterium]
MKEKRVLYVDIVSWHVRIHRMALIREAITKGYDVHVALPHAGREPALRALGSSIHKVALSRKGMEPFQEGWSIGELARLYRRLRPRLVHHLTLKPVLYGTLAATAARVPAVLNAVTGLGYLFDDHGPAFRAAREVALRLLRPALRRKNVYFLFQNADDRAEFERRGLAAPERTRLLPGSGVDVERFAPQPPPNGTPAVVLPARLLRPKGVLEFVQAARLLRREGVQARFILAGSPDPGN